MKIAYRQTNQGVFMKYTQFNLKIKQISVFSALAFILLVSTSFGQAQRKSPDELGKSNPFGKCRAFGIQQAPALPGAQPISSRDRVYTADQTSNTISVIDPSTNTLLGTRPLGNARPDELLGALYNKQINTHGLGFSSDGSLLAAIDVTTNGVSIIETLTNRVLGTIYLRRAPHEGFFTPDCRELWVAVRGEDRVAVIDVNKMQEVDRIQTSDGAAMVIFRPDGQVAFVNSSRKAELDVVDVRSHQVIRRLTGLVSPFSPNLAASPDNQEVWLTHKDVGKITIVNAQNFTVLGVIETGKTTNHVNFVSKPNGNFAYVTVGGLNQVKVYRRNGGTPQLVATIPTGADPHGIWASPDNTRVYICLENGDAVQVIDTTSNTVISTIPVGQMPQALVYVANAVPSGDGRSNLTGQNVGLRIEAFEIIITGGGKADVVLRELVGVDSVEVAATELTAGAKYNVFAVKADGTLQLIGDFRADAMGKGSVNPLLKFFDAGFVRVEVQRAG